MTVGAMTFLPYVRSGLANKITTPDDGSPAVTLRAKIDVSVEIRGEKDGVAVTPAAITRPVELIGPGDIVGLDSRSIIRTEPRNGITNFEPNYLAFVEFYDEDLPWRYTPAKPAGDRLRPWLTLVVLKENEFSDEPYQTTRPLSAIKILDVTGFPSPDDMAGWAHVHYNGALVDPATVKSADGVGIAANLQSAVAANPDTACSRLLCPRKLDANAVYHAFLIPTFESGRLAGIGLDPSATPATQSAWDATTRQAPDGIFPFYHRYTFRTGGPGDFEYLVRLLKPRPADHRVGRRDIDTQYPGWAVRGVTAFGGVMKLGGALRAPLTGFSASQQVLLQQEEAWDASYPQPFQSDLANFVNLSDAYTANTAEAANTQSTLTGVADNPDPMVTPPIYGHWHALTHRLLYASDGSMVPNNRNWLHNLNLDPRNRVAAGLGTGVVRKDAQNLMRAAWAQVGDVIEANRLLRLSQLSAGVSHAAYSKHVVAMAAASPERALMMTAPVHSRLMGSPVTIRRLVDQSATPLALMSPAMRRIARTGGPVARSLGFTAQKPAAAAMARVNSGELSIVPPTTASASLPTIDQAAASQAPVGVPRPIVNLLARARYLPLLVLVVSLAAAAALAAFGGIVGAVAGAAVAVGGVLAYRALTRLTNQARGSQALREQAMTPAAVDRMPASPGFRLTDPSQPVSAGGFGADNLEAVNFKKALKDSYVLNELAASSVQQPALPLDIAGVTEKVINALDPMLTIPRLVDSQISYPPWMVSQSIRMPLVEAMYYPRFDQPMYKPLVARSTELFLPNIHLVAENSITLLETNQAFIESYMVGLNYEFARKLLWNDYPTDQRGSYFRQFWDIAGFLDTSGGDPVAARERLRDIPPIHTWDSTSTLGEHDNRASAGEPPNKVVLVIRGELLKKYPTAVIYAQKAAWQTDAATGAIQPSKERRPVDLTPAQEAAPPTSILKTPLYQAKVEPDIYFLGFDLTVDEARGGSGLAQTDPAGWFFVIKERPSEPRFGLDIGAGANPPKTWNDLTWDVALPSGSNILPFARTSALSVVNTMGTNDDEHPQWVEDTNVAWNATVSAADLAYILYQAPVRVFVHAAEMLAAV